MIPLPLRDGALFIDNSFLEQLQQCPRMLEYNQLYRRHLAAARPGLNFGTAGHLALDYRYSHFPDVPTLPYEKMQFEDEQVKILQAHFLANPQPEDSHRNLNWAVEVFVKHYNERYACEPFNLIMDEKGKPIVERAFAIPFLAYAPRSGTVRRIASLAEINQPVRMTPGMTSVPEGELAIIYSGKIDLPILWDGYTFILDHKTTSIMGESFWDSLRMSPQQLGYSWAWWKITGQMPIGFVVNAIRTTMMPAKPKAGPSAWWEESFQRLKEYISPRHLEEWETNVISLIEEFLWHHRRGYFPTKKSWCVGKFGKCQFYEVCYGAPENRSELLASAAYADYTWSALGEVKPTTL